MEYCDGNPSEIVTGPSQIPSQSSKITNPIQLPFKIERYSVTISVTISFCDGKHLSQLSVTKIVTDRVPSQFFRHKLNCDGGFSVTISVTISVFPSQFLTFSVTISVIICHFCRSEVPMYQRINLLPLTSFSPNFLVFYFCSSNRLGFVSLFV